MDKLEYLYKMLEKYHTLNNKTNNKYDWRERLLMTRLKF